LAFSPETPTGRSLLSLSNGQIIKIGQTTGEAKRLNRRASTAAEAMRKILIERARQKRSAKRGGDWCRVASAVV
jgi:hypothetical protein